MSRLIILFTMCAALTGKSQSWSAVGTFTGFPWCMGTFNNDVYLGAADTLPDFPPTKLLYKLNASSWNADPTADSYYGSQSDAIRCMQVYNGQLYFGGSFATLAGVSPQRCLVTKSGNSWVQLGSGFVQGSSVSAMTVWNNKLYATGNFTTAGGVTVNHIAAWDGTNWSALGTGLDYDAMSVTSFSGNLYVAGLITQAGSVTVNGIAKWDGTAWSDAGMSQTVVCLPFCMTEYNNELYAGGLFMLDPNTQYLSTVVKWNGTNWQDVGTGIGLGAVYAMTSHKNELYVAGSGTLASGLPVKGIGKWNGTSWSAVGGGLSGKPDMENVMGLLSRPEGLYACGNFTSAGGLPVSNVALWGTPTALAEVDHNDRGSFYPNPATSQIFFSGLDAENSSVCFFDMTGRCVLVAPPEKNAVNIASLPNGVYEMKVTTGKETINHRVVVNR